MGALSQWCAPGPELDWASLQSLPWVQAMRGVPQDPVHHAEGDVWIHTRMVLQELLRLPAWQALVRRERELVFVACLLHDVAKPWTTRVEGERVRAPGHSRAGAITARALLHQAGVDPSTREEIAALVKRHQLPFFAVEDAHPEDRLALVSQSTRLDWLSLVNRADARGRVCSDPERLEENNQLFELLARELGCWDRPYPLHNAHARFQLGRKPGATRHDAPPEFFSCEVLITCGLPGAGKDTWLARHRPELPQVSLDAIRKELGVDPREHQGPVIGLARERAKEHLRAERSFAWNATSLSRELRERVVSLARRYGARVHIVVVDPPWATVQQRNAAREERVPPAVVEALLGRWEFPEPQEAHEITWVRA